MSEHYTEHSNVRQRGRIYQKELVQKYGYPFETHEITTEDGYILTIYRIPHGKNGTAVNGTPILLMHGTTAQAESFLVNGVNNGSWAYYLADNGYDVWLGNTRGTNNGKKHLVLDPKMKEFWNFSLDEIALYDLPATIDYILKRVNKPQLSYLANSQGCTIFFIMCSLRAEYQKKIIIASMLGPAGYMKYFSYPFLLPLTVWPDKLQHVLETIGIFEVFPGGPLIDQLLLTVSTSILSPIAVAFYRIALGGGYTEFTDELVPLLVKFMTSVSMYQLIHYAQHINSGHFRPFDYGIRKNMEIYGKPQPDDYPIHTIEVPIAMYYSIDDQLINYKDVEEMCDDLPKCVRRFVMPYQGWNHMDFVLAVNLRQALMKPVVKFSQQYETDLFFV